MDQDRTRAVLAAHKKWADAWSLVSFIVVMGVFAMVYFLFEQTNEPAANRIQAFILLATIVIVIVLWQAAGAVVARLELLLSARSDADLRP